MEEDKKVVLSIDASSSVTYAFYQAEALRGRAANRPTNAYSFLHGLSIDNETDEDLKDLVVRFEVSPSEALSIKPIRITSLEKGKVTAIDSIEKVVQASYLYDLTEKVPGSVKAIIETMDGTVLGEDTKPLSFLPIEESASEGWTPEIFASFVTPHEPCVEKIFARAADIKKEKTGNPSFEGYLAKDPNLVVEEVNAIYSAIQECRISYALPPASFEKIQRVRLPSHVLSEGCATCLDFSLLFASVLEAAGLNPILIMFHGHAYIGVWLEEMSFPTPIMDESQVLLNEASKGSQRILLLESTFLRDDSSNFALKDAADAAYERLLKEPADFVYAIDVAAARKEEILPIPSKGSFADGADVFTIYPSDKGDSSLPTIDMDARRHLDPSYQGRKERFDYWEDKLLDLNLRNRLISYKTGQAGIEFLSADPEKVIDFLERNEKIRLVPGVLSFDIVPPYSPAAGRLELPPALSEKALEGFSQGFLCAVSPDNDPESGLKSLSRKSNAAIEESGCNPLFLSLGLIRHFDNPKAAEHNKSPLFAPIFLIPARLPRRKSGSYYTLECSLDDIQLNRTAFEYFHETAGLSFDRLNPMPRLPSGKIDVRLILNEIRSIIEPMRNWGVIESTFSLSLFNFAHFVMWSDLVTHRREMLLHPGVRSFALGASSIDDPSSEKEEVAPDSLSAKDIAAPLPADSSQLSAINAALNGESFILDGPPGTGKSQTIANMIVNFLYHGKKVLFVAEKEVALDVVKRRLDDLHLGDFALKLANLAATKTEILSNYGRLLDMGPLSEAEGHSEKAKEIDEERNRLQGVMDSLHDDRGDFTSPYEAIIAYLSKEGHRTSAEIPSSYIDSLTNRSYREAMESLEETARLASLFGSYAKTPFKAYRDSEYSLEKRKNLEEGAKTLLALAEKLRLDAYNAMRHANIKTQSRNNVEAYLSLLTLLKAGAHIDWSRMDDETYLTHIDRIIEGLEVRKNLLEAEREASFYWNERAIYIDAEDLIKRAEMIEHLSFFKRFKGKRGFLNGLKPYFIDPKAKRDFASAKDALAILPRLKALKEKEAALDPYAKAVLSKEDLSSASLIDSYRERALATSKAASFYSKLELRKEDGDVIEGLSELGEGLIFGKENEALCASYESFLSLSKDLLSKDFDISFYGDAPDYFSFLSGKLRDLLASLGRLSEWTNFLKAYEASEKAVPSSFLEEYQNGEIPEKTLVDSYIADVSYAYLGIALPKRGVASVTYESLRSLIASYRDDIARYQSLSVIATAERVSASFPRNAAHFASSTEANQLSKLAHNGGRGVSLRNLFRTYKSLISKLTPCFMMSPATLAQYLDPADFHFDVVIFDEASQIPTSEAIGAIFRADSFIIAGDKEQMPPSHYFTSDIGAKDINGSFASLDEDLESLLDDALALHLPRRRLTWHYRSRHESLIAFSNNRFYGNSLLTFPSPREEGQSVEFHRVKGVYERGKGINRKEAEAVVAEIVRRLKSPSLRTRSIGVVTFNEAQQNLVEDLLEKALSKRGGLDIAPGGESIFVKNLENVQGDERDIILFSVGYGPDQYGVFSINFGPLSRKKGERRLNVAASRAREAMVVFASFEPEDMRVSGAKNEGASYLKDFLLFAKRGFSALPNRLGNVENDLDTNIGCFLAEDLRKLGYIVEEDFGSSTFKIDCAIALKDNPDEYVLGILLDNRRSSAMTPRDLYVNEISVLNRLSWNLYSLFAVEYLDHREEVLKAIVNEINACLVHKEEDEPTGKASIPELKKKPFMPSRNLKPYEIYKYHGGMSLSEYLFYLVNIEYPIGNSTMDARIREAFGLGRISSNIRSKIDYEIKRNGFSEEYCGKYVFYYPRNFDCMSYRFWRKTDETTPDRRLIDIGFIEIGNCAADILFEQGSMSLDDLAKAVATALGYGVLTKTYANYLKCGLRWNSPKRNGIYIDEDGMVSLR